MTKPGTTSSPLGLLAGLLVWLALGSTGLACRTNLPAPPVEDGGAGGTGQGAGGAPGTGGSLPDTNSPVDRLDGTAPVDVAPTCGEPNQACCPGNRCLNGGCCERGICTSYGDVCKLSPGSSCLGGTCSNECGGVVNGVSMKCCPMHNCTAALTVCDATGATVGACVSCGKPGQPCCSDNNGVHNYCEGALNCTGGKCPGGSVDAAPPADTTLPPISADAGKDAVRG